MGEFFCGVSKWQITNAAMKNNHASEKYGDMFMILKNAGFKTLSTKWSQFYLLSKYAQKYGHKSNIRRL